MLREGILGLMRLRKGMKGEAEDGKEKRKTEIILL